MAFWLKTIGTAENHLPTDWMTVRGETLAHTWFARRPSVSAGDHLIYYAAGKHVVCAVMDVVSEPVEGQVFPDHWSQEDRQRWPWAVRVNPRITVRADDTAPALADVGISTLRVRRQSHIALDPEEFQTAARALSESALRTI